MKNPKAITWMNRPPRMMFCAVAVLEPLPLASIPDPTNHMMLAIKTPSQTWDREDQHVPPDRTKNESISVVTKIFVSHFFRIKLNFSPSTAMIMRPSTIYILAEISAGATRIRIDWMMNGPRVQFGDCLDDWVRAT